MRASSRTVISSFRSVQINTIIIIFGIQGYGFNLHAERDKPGQYIGLVDDDSPASSAGLRVQDRIIEVNGVNVEQEKHPEVIARIKAIPGEAKLLVVDRETDIYCKEKGIAISSSLSQTEYIVTKEATSRCFVMFLVCINFIIIFFFLAYIFFYIHQACVYTVKSQIF